MNLVVLVIDESLGEVSFAQQLLEELENVASAFVLRNPEESFPQDLVPDVLVLGAEWLGYAREFRKRFPHSAIIGRGPWQGEVLHEFFPWGDQLREPTLPLPQLIPSTGTF